VGRCVWRLWGRYTDAGATAAAGGTSGLLQHDAVSRLSSGCSHRVRVCEVRSQWHRAGGALRSAVYSPLWRRRAFPDEPSLCRAAPMQSCRQCRYVRRPVRIRWVSTRSLPLRPRYNRSSFIATVYRRKSATTNRTMKNATETSQNYNRPYVSYTWTRSKMAFICRIGLWNNTNSWQ